MFTFISKYGVVRVPAASLDSAWAALARNHWCPEKVSCSYGEIEEREALEERGSATTSPQTEAEPTD